MVSETQLALVIGCLSNDISYHFLSSLLYSGPTNNLSFLPPCICTYSSLP